MNHYSVEDKAGHLQNLLARAQLAIERARALSVEVSQAVCSDRSSMQRLVESPERGAPSLSSPAQFYTSGPSVAQQQ